jgi:hypothetical protein
MAGRGCYNCGDCRSNSLSRHHPSLSDTFPAFSYLLSAFFFIVIICHLICLPDGHQAAACPKAGTPTWSVFVHASSCNVGC